MTDQVLRSRRTTARLEQGAVLLDRFGTGLRVRIPLTAIETVRARGPEGRRGIEIVLTSGPDGSVPVTYPLRPSSAAAATAFAAAVNSALPVRDAAEPRRDGSAAVSVLPTPPRVRRPGAGWTAGERAAWWFYGGLFVLGLGLTIATGDREVIVIWTAFYTVFLVGCSITTAVCRSTKDWWLLRRRGITVVATYERTDYGTGSDGETTSTKVYTFTDIAGVEREYLGGGKLVATDPERIEVTYDPGAPERMSSRSGPVVRLLLFLAYVLLGLPISLLTAAYPVIYLSFVVAALM
ncbi:hypothetical protein EOT10_09790 [Streptomyces antnestii]|uniref:PH domain-containing protein n=1 Tax=Streptomyces antnestii TaxID=2494256 RepID=A0A437PYU5_9ACTN|nr:hypothetical protein [Streptomyces sp. San01]RVU27445.1 hypothetical protein EOT10_09790 [Streptomyces sp. San01]